MTGNTGGFPRLSIRLRSGRRLTSPSLHGRKGGITAHALQAEMTDGKDCLDVQSPIAILKDLLPSTDGRGIKTAEKRVSKPDGKHRSFTKQINTPS